MKTLLSILFFTLSTYAFSASIDDDLNQTYQTALKIAVTPKQLKQSQLSWSKYAKLHCYASKPHSREPEYASGYEDNCLNELKAERIKQLKNSFIN